MQICRTVADIRALTARWRRDRETIGLVPTMGALHDGHLTLVAEARAVHDRVVATIFVNPTQFGSSQDLAAYPRTEAQDVALLESARVDALFIPEISEIYPEGDETIVETTRLSGLFHGAVRPGHFRGVATVVTKLFNIVQADEGYFGEKDYQQLAVIRRMVRDLHIPTRIRGVATVRAPDGLALSSRNARLTPEDRAAAPVLHRALTAAETAWTQGASIEEITEILRATIASEPRARLRGLDIVDASDFTPATGRPARRFGIMISAEFGPEEAPVLLIDQREIAPLTGA